jgi:hypothetical protein
MQRVAVYVNVFIHRICKIWIADSVCVCVCTILPSAQLVVSEKRIHNDREEARNIPFDFHSTTRPQ